MLRTAACVALMTTLITSCIPPIPQAPQTSLPPDERVAPAASWAQLQTVFEACDAEISRVRSVYQSQLRAGVAYNSLAATTGAIGGALTTAGLIAEDGAEADAVSGVGAVVSAAGPVVFSIVAQANNPQENRVALARMLRAHDSAQAYLSQVVACASALYEYPPLLQEPDPSDAVEVEMHTRFLSECSVRLASPIPAPGQGEATADAASNTGAEPDPPEVVASGLGPAARRSYVARHIRPEMHFSKIQRYLRQYCRLSVPTPVERIE